MEEIFFSDNKKKFFSLLKKIFLIIVILFCFGLYYYYYQEKTFRNPLLMRIPSSYYIINKKKIYLYSDFYKDLKKKLENFLLINIVLLPDENIFSKNYLVDNIYISAHHINYSKKNNCLDMSYPYYKENLLYFNNKKKSENSAVSITFVLADYEIYHYIKEKNGSFVFFNNNIDRMLLYIKYFSHYNLEIIIPQSLWNNLVSIIKDIFLNYFYINEEKTSTITFFCGFEKDKNNYLFLFNKSILYLENNNILQQIKMNNKLTVIPFKKEDFLR